LLLRDWFMTWRDKPTARSALRLLEEVGGTERHLANTLQRIAEACFNAVHYRPDLDPGKVYRAEIISAKKQIGQLARAARVLALGAAGKNKGLMWAMTKAELDSGVRLTRAEKDGPMELTVVAERYFRSLEAALRGTLPELSGGPFLHNCTIGNLIFDKPISAGRPLTVTTMLAFELTIYMRMHTAGNAEDSLQNGSPMPDYDGDPCFPVVAAFCTAALGTQLDAKQTGDNVRKLRNVGLISWPRTD
jgi:hypothetical protein